MDRYFKSVFINTLTASIFAAVSFLLFLLICGNVMLFENLLTGADGTSSSRIVLSLLCIVFSAVSAAVGFLSSAKFHKSKKTAGMVTAVISCLFSAVSILMYFLLVPVSTGGLLITFPAFMAFIMMLITCIRAAKIPHEHA